MDTLQDLFPEIERLQSREAILWSNGFRTRVSTYADLYGRIGATVRHFDERGVGKGDRVLIWAENRLEWIAVFWACVARGIQIVPVDFRFSLDLVERIGSESSPKLVMNNATLDELAVLSPCRFKPTPAAPDDVVEIVYTSGTTGEPKGVVHRHRNICSNLRPFQNEIAKYKKWARPFQPVRILDLLPLSHMFGQSLGLFMPLFLEGAAVFTNEIHPGRIIQFTHDHRISVIVCVPRILENLKNEVERWTEQGGGKWGLTPPTKRDSSPVFGIPLRERGQTPFPSVPLKMWHYRKLHRRFGWKFWAFVVGAARVDPNLEEFWKQRGFAVIQGYGLTEASMVIAVNHPFSARTGSVGKVLEGQDVRIAPDGEILVRGENVTESEGDWLHTGDLGEIDSEGRLYFRGRKKNTIVTPDGLNVYPDDIEAVLNSFPEIRESAVVGTDHVHAVLILKEPSANLDALVRQANSRLESHQRIRDWSIWPNNEFPRTASTLKLKRQEIARQLHAKPEHAPSTVLPDLSAISSLERVELLSELENKYQIELDEESFAKLTSTPELENWLRRPEIAAAKVEPETPPSEWARLLPIRWLRVSFQDVIAAPLYRHYLPLTVTGLENLRGLQPPVIFAANHTSHLDVPTIYAALPHRWHQRLAPAMMKEHFRAYFEPRGRSLKEIMLAGFSYFLACSLYNAYPLPQMMAGTRRALAYTGELIDRGYCPIVFPEGLRTSDGTLQKFRPGIGMMAVRLQVPIVPIRLSGLYEIYSLHDSWPRRGPVHVCIGAPMSFGVETGYEEVARRFQEVIASMT